MGNPDYAQYLCLDFTAPELKGAYIGGSRSLAYYSYIVAIFQRCNPDLSVCKNKTNIQTVVNNYNNSFAIEYSYPVTFYNGAENDALFSTYYIRRLPMDFTFLRQDYFYFDDVLLQDDTGWIVESSQSYEKLSAQSRETTLRVNDRPEDFLEQYGSFSITMNNIRPRYRRTYMKIQDLAALMGGFMKAILSAAQIMVIYINTYLRKTFLFNYLFENKPLIKRDDRKR
jgi:hypothetical protein